MKRTVLAVSSIGVAFQLAFAPVRALPPGDVPSPELNVARLPRAARLSGTRVQSDSGAGRAALAASTIPATLVSSPTNQTASAGSDVTLSAQITGSPNEFQWYRNGIPLPEAPYFLGSRQTTLKIVGATLADGGRYQLKWTNPASGAGETAVAILVVTGHFVRWSGSTDIVADPVHAPLPSAGEVVTNANSFTLRTSGYDAFDRPTAVGDNGFFRYEAVTGDFDKRVRLVSLVMNPPENSAAAFFRGSLAVRQSTNANAAELELAAVNPTGTNLVRVIGRGRIDQIVSRRLSRDYPGVNEILPNQWLRLQRVGDSFSFYVGTNGSNWSLIAQQYQEFPSTVLVGTYAAADDANGNGAVTEAQFADYGDVTNSEGVALTFVSAGTFDQRLIGLKFSKPVNSLSATKISNYTLNPGTIMSARLGIGGDAVYLQVNGLTNDAFTISASGIVDSAGNALAAGSVIGGKKVDWRLADIGYFQDANLRPTFGDDPYRVGQAVALSSDPNPEFELIGGGSNVSDAGDFIEYLYRPYAGDFDVAVAVNRFDRRGISGGLGHAGIHVRSALNRADNHEIGEETKVAAYINAAYYEAAEGNRAAVQLNRPNTGFNYDLGSTILNTEEIGGLTGFYTGLRAVNAAGQLANRSSATQAHWLRVKRRGTKFTSLHSYDGVTWVEGDGAGLELPNLSGTVLVGFGIQNDTGLGVPPENTYPGNGTLNPEGQPTQNESNYGVLRISHFGDFAGTGTAPTLSIRLDGTDLVVTYTGTLQSADTLKGTFSPVNGASPLRLPLSSVTGAKFFRSHD